MVTFVIIFQIKENNRKVYLFKPYFFVKYKNRCKMIYKNKIFPLKFSVSIKRAGKLKIELMFYNDDAYLEDIVKGCISFSEIYLINIYKNYIKKFKKIRCRFWNWSGMEYLTSTPQDKLDILKNDFSSIIKTGKIPKLKKIKIFGEKFVENNKNKCFIVYNNRIYPLQEYLSVTDTENENSIKINT